MHSDPHDTLAQFEATVKMYALMADTDAIMNPSGLTIAEAFAARVAAAVPTFEADAATEAEHQAEYKRSCHLMALASLVPYGRVHDRLMEGADNAATRMRELGIVLDARSRTRQAVYGG